MRTLSPGYRVFEKLIWHALLDRQKYPTYPEYHGNGKPGELVERLTFAERIKLETLVADDIQDRQS